MTMEHYSSENGKPVTVQYKRLKKLDEVGAPVKCETLEPHRHSA